MRFVLFSLFFAFWVLMWWWTYSCHIKTSCCPDFQEKRTTQLIEVDRADPRPLVFRWGEAQPVATAQYGSMRDSLVAALAPGQMLEVTGGYFRDESESGVTGDLGLFRAKAMRGILASQIDTSLIAVRSKVMPLSGDVRDRFFSALTFRAMTLNAHVREKSDHIVLLLPQDTSEIPQAVDSCLTIVAQELSTSSQTIELTGYSRGTGSAREVELQATKLAQFVKGLLVNKDISSDRIAVTGKVQVGTDQGSTIDESQKHRVELRIFNER